MEARSAVVPRGARRPQPSAVINGPRPARARRHLTVSVFEAVLTERPPAAVVAER